MQKWQFFRLGLVGMRCNKTGLEDGQAQVIAQSPIDQSK